MYERNNQPNLLTNLPTNERTNQQQQTNIITKSSKKRISNLDRILRSDKTRDSGNNTYNVNSQQQQQRHQQNINSLP